MSEPLPVPKLEGVYLEIMKKELAVPTMSDFISAGSADPLREDMFEKLLDERDMLFEALHAMVLRFGHRVKREAEFEVMDRAREALDKINPEWRREHASR